MHNIYSYINSPIQKIKSEKYIVTAATNSDSCYLEELLISLSLYGDVENIPVVVMGINAGMAIAAICKKHNATFVQGTCNEYPGEIILRYSFSEFLDCSKILYISPRSLVLQSLAGIFDVVDENKEVIHVTRKQSALWAKSLRQYLDRFDIASEVDAPQVWSSLFYVCSSLGLSALYKYVSSFEYLDLEVFDEAIFNMALASLANVNELDLSYNLQFYNDILKFDYQNKNIAAAFVGLNLEHIKSPAKVMNKLLDSENPLSKVLRKKIQYEDQKWLFKYSYDRQETLQRIQCALSIANLQVGLLDNVTSADIMSSDLEKYFATISDNKNALEECYLDDEDRCGVYLVNRPISIINISNDNLQHKVIRSFILDLCSIKKKRIRKPRELSKVKFLISTHKDYQDKTLPRLLHSLTKVNGVDPADILVVSGGWQGGHEEIKDGIRYHNTWHNSFDFTGLIHVVMNNIESEYWMALHDTSEVGNDFLKLIDEFDYETYDHVSVDIRGLLNMGMFSWGFLKRSERFLMNMLHCSKLRAMYSEQYIYRMGYSRPFGDKLHFIGIGDMYNTGSCRHILYYEDIDVYKYQANIDATLEIRKI